MIDLIQRIVGSPTVGKERLPRIAQTQMTGEADVWDQRVLFTHHSSLRIVPCQETQQGRSI
jgi:hypothetical protein